MSSLRLPIALAVVLAAPTSARAEINVADSLEWMVVDADLVVRGRVSSVSITPGPGQVTYERARVEIDETLKGPAAGSVEILVRHIGAREAPSRWRAESAELLLFLVDSKRRAGEDKTYTSAPFALRAGAGSFVRLDPRAQKREVFPMDQSVLTARAAILGATRGAARFRGATRATPFNLDVPFDRPAFKRLWAGSSVWLRVPVDARLERMARAATRSAELDRRTFGARALAEFKSPVNVALMKKLLADPGVATQTFGDGRKFKVWPVRQIALDALRAWGVGNLTPTTRVRLK